MLRRWGLLCLILGCSTGGGYAQQGAAPSVPAESATPHTGPITFNVVVTDKAGQPIHGLRQEDFTLLDHRQPTPIRSFAAHEVTAQPNDPQAIFLVLDDVNASFNAVSLERTQIQNFLQSHGGHLPVPVSLFLVTDNGPEQITPVSSDGNALVNILRQKKGQLHDIPRSAGFYGAAERLDLSLHALQSISTYLGSAQGRKLLIWVSPGWPIFDSPNIIVSNQQQRALFGTIVSLSTRLREENVTLYAVDPLGTWDAAGPRTFLWQNFLKPVTKPNKADPGDLALQVLAQQSGGKIYNGSNDVAGEIAKCADDVSAWYTVTFDPQHADADVTWHDVQIRVDKPGLTVRTRNGYYAQP